MTTVNTQKKAIQQAFDDLDAITRDYHKNDLSSMGKYPLSNRLKQVSHQLISLPFSREDIEFSKQKHKESRSLSESLKKRLDKHEEKHKAPNGINPILTDEYTDAVLSGDTKTVNRLEAKARNAIKSKHSSKEKYEALLIPTIKATRQTSYWSRIVSAVEDSVLSQKITKKNDAFDLLLAQLKPIWAELNQLHGSSHSHIPAKHLDNMLEVLNHDRIKERLQQYFFEINSRRVYN